MIKETANTRYEALFQEREDMRDDIIHRLGSNESPTAIFCYNDDYARDVAALAWEAGLSIPEDLSLVGFGNLPTNEPTIALTSFDQHPREIGIAAAQMYFERIAESERSAVKRLRIPPDLVVRQSTRPVSNR